MGLYILCYCGDEAKEGRVMASSRCPHLGFFPSIFWAILSIFPPSIQNFFFVVPQGPVVLGALLLKAEVSAWYALFLKGKFGLYIAVMIDSHT